MEVALEMGRNAIGIDLNPSFCDIIVDRLDRIIPAVNDEDAGTTELVA